MTTTTARMTALEPRLRTESAERAPLPIYPNSNEAERLEAQTR